MLDLRHAGARSEELSRGGAVRRFLGGALEVERESFVVGGLDTLLLGSPGCSTALGHDSMRLMRSLIAMRSSSSMPERVEHGVSASSSPCSPWRRRYANT